MIRAHTLLAMQKGEGRREIDTIQRMMLPVRMKRTEGCALINHFRLKRCEGFCVVDLPATDRTGAIMV